MEYLDGKTLKQVIRDEGPLSLARTVEIMRQVGDALNVAHSQNVVHRDLKSDNIMLLSTAMGVHAKVLDFGIAKINEPEGEFDNSLTAPNLVIGTPQYMSPEQCSQDKGIDARSDIYSFGVILYEMLVGHVPFTGDSPTIIMMKHLQDPVPSVLEERSDVPPAPSALRQARPVGHRGSEERRPLRHALIPHSLLRRRRRRRPRPAPGACRRPPRPPGPEPRRTGSHGLGALARGDPAHGVRD
jgi:serine/threonine protein kinase